jgi:pyruvate dehydrogenase E2 component (dihydrolipoamide acetyltransferase)
MPTTVIMPALELAQETGKVLRWIKAPGDTVRKGEPLVEIETDKVTVELEAPAAGVLRDVTAQEGDVIPVGQAIAMIYAPGEAAGGHAPASTLSGTSTLPSQGGGEGGNGRQGDGIKASPLARRLAAEHGVDLAQVKSASGKIEKADVLAHVERRAPATASATVRLTAASPKARRLAAERGLDLRTLHGSGPSGAILTADLPAGAPAAPLLVRPAAARGEGVSNIWRIMADRMTASWTSAPHFYLVREVNVGRLIAWRERLGKPGGARITYTDLLVRLVAAALTRHPAANAAWADGGIIRHAEVNVGLAVAVEDGLVVPVLHRADALDVAAIAARREDLVTRAQAGRLRPADIQGGGFTISNLGMYGVDAFNAIVNPPQAAILAVGRIADRVVALNGQPAVQPTMVLTLSCDHRALDGARGAQFLGTLADLIEEPLALLA